MDENGNYADKEEIQKRLRAVNQELLQYKASTSSSWSSLGPARSARTIQQLLEDTYQKGLPSWAGANPLYNIRGVIVWLLSHQSVEIDSNFQSQLEVLQQQSYPPEWWSDFLGKSVQPPSGDTSWGEDDKYNKQVRKAVLDTLKKYLDRYQS